MSAIARARAHERACNLGREWAGTVDTGKTSPQRARKTSCRCGTRACVCTEKVRANHLVEQHNVVVLNQLQQHGEALALAVVAINQEAPAEIHPRGQKAPARPRRATISSQLHENGTRCEPLRPLRHARCRKAGPAHVEREDAEFRRLGHGSRRRCRRGRAVLAIRHPAVPLPRAHCWFSTWPFGPAKRLRTFNGRPRVTRSRG